MAEHEIKLSSKYTVTVDENQIVRVYRDGLSLPNASNNAAILLALEVRSLREQLTAYKRYEAGKK